MQPGADTVSSAVSLNLPPNYTADPLEPANTRYMISLLEACRMCRGIFCTLGLQIRVAKELGNPTKVGRRIR